VDNLLAFDHAQYLLNFRSLELGLAADGTWSAYLRAPCRFLDRASGLCRVHDTALQPGICARYNSFGCWYKTALIPGLSDRFIRIDLRRMAFVAERVRFDEQRNLVRIPSWPEMLEALPEIPLADDFEDIDLADPVFDAWLRESLVTPPGDALPYLRYDEFVDACTDCGAWCCRTLLFPQPTPQARSNIDYFQFVLGFPGTELGVSDHGWSVVVKTACRHLADGRCALHGRPDRPLICRQYDASACQYRVEYGLPRPPDYLRVRLEQLAWLTEPLTFDERGTLGPIPPVSALRDHVEARWRKAVAAANAEAAAPTP